MNHITEYDKRRAEELYPKPDLSLGAIALSEFSEMAVMRNAYLIACSEKNEEMEMEKEVFGFAQWSNTSNWEYYTKQGVWYDRLRYKPPMTTAELYELYKQQKQ